MSIDKFTSRGFGSSGASRSSRSAPRESYKPSSDQGSNFLFGGAGLRGGPQSGGQHRALPKGGGSELSSHAKRLGEESCGVGDSADQKRFRGIDMSGGDETTTSVQRRVIFVGLLVGALMFSVLIRACAGGSSDNSWVGEHRAHINPDDE